MESFSLIIVIQIVNAYSASGIFVRDGIENPKFATANIVNRCFASSERGSELLIISHNASHESLGKIHQRSETSNSVVFLDSENEAEFKYPEKRNDYLNSGVEWQKRNPGAVLIIADGSKHLKSVLNFMKNSGQSIWKPESYFLVVLETGCSVAECNDMFKVIWDRWILNAVILCPSNDSSDLNGSEIDLYTFNPYSADHSRQWETIVHETIVVSIDQVKFNHSWYIFKQSFTRIGSSNYCGDLFFDKTSNLDGYLIPISVGYSEFLTDTRESLAALVFAVDSKAFRTLAKLLRFNGVQLPNTHPDVNGNLPSNGSYYDPLGDVHKGRSHLLPNARSMGLYPGLGMTYPHATFGICFASRISGVRPQWKNYFNAKNIGLLLGTGLIFTTAQFYMLNRSRGFVPAWLDAVRLFAANSITYMPTQIKYRYVLGANFFVILVCECSVKGRLISIINVISSYSNLDTLEQLKEQNVDVYADSTSEHAINNAGIQLRINSLETEECVTLLERDERQRACFADCQTLQVFARNSTVIHVASTRLLNSYATFLATMHWPLTDRYSYELQKLLETGILTKWKLDVFREIELKVWKVKKKMELPVLKPTKVIDLLIPFSEVIAGLAISLIVFAWEIKCGKNIGRIKP